MKLKVCGVTRLEQMQQLQELGVDFAGLIFYEGSKRFAGEKLKGQKSEIKNLEIKKVGVFVNAATETIENAIEDYELGYVQLHGDETPEFCRQVQKLVPVIKAIQIGPGTDLDKSLEKFKSTCDYFLFDTASKQYGGTGIQFEWIQLAGVNIDKPFFLSGGIGLDDAEKVNAFYHPLLFAIDVNSRFEISPGVKDMEQVSRFLQKIR